MQRAATEDEIGCGIGRLAEIPRHAAVADRAHTEGSGADRRDPGVSVGASERERAAAGLREVSRASDRAGKRLVAGEIERQRDA